MVEIMICADDTELAVTLYMADEALPRQEAFEKLLKMELENVGYLTGGEGRPPEIVNGQSSSDYVQYKSYLDEDC